MKHVIYLLLGSNQGDKIALLKKACKEIAVHIGTIKIFSSFYESEPWGFEADEWFVNQVLQVETILTPEELLTAVQQIEQQLGRVRRQSASYESRAIDIDILFYDMLALQTKELVIPHPRIQERHFTLLPLTEIAPTFRHPLLQKNIATLLHESGDNGVVRRL